MEALPPPKELSFVGNTAENWRRWLQQFQYFMAASGRDKKDGVVQCATLLHCAGETAQEIVNTLAIPADKKDENGQCKDLKCLIEKFEAYCTPKKNVTLERHTFTSREQAKDGTFDHYLTDLRILIDIRAVSMVTSVMVF